MNRTTIVTLLLFLIWGCTQSLFAQVDNPYFLDDTHTISVSRRTILYVPLGEDSIIQERNSGEWSEFRSISYLSCLNKKRVAENADIPVIGFIKSEIGLEDYDFYIVNYKGHLYYLSKDSCQDNSLIDAKNIEIRECSESLKKEIEKLSNDFIRRVETKAKQASNQLAILNEKGMSIVDSLTKARVVKENDELLNSFNIWLESLDDTRKKASNILVIHRSELSKPNSAAGCDYTMTFTNTSPKTIKYLDWKGNAYNAVDDVVSCEIRNSSLLQGRVTGPINANVEHSGTWETIIYNWSAKRIRLTGISIIYTDGTKANLSSKEIDAILGAPYKQLSMSQRVLIRNHAMTEMSLQRDSLKTLSNYLSSPENARFSTAESLAQERELYKHITELGQEFMRLRRKNSLPIWEVPANVEKLLGAVVY
ncbi:MAG: hypothetical protein LKJ87_07430 [Bacteroidales bacterium]|jgi:hypothetical protein|nr:hypothetical protein [Bacteroidales bacterium]